VRYFEHELRPGRIPVHSDEPKVSDTNLLDGQVNKWGDLISQSAHKRQNDLNFSRLGLVL